MAYKQTHKRKHTLYDTYSVGHTDEQRQKLTESNFDDTVETVLGYQ